MIDSRIFAATTTLLAVFFIAGGPLIAADKKEDKPATPTFIKHTAQQVEGWTVHVDNQLLKEQKETGDVALKVLANRLYDLTLILPEPVVAKLQTVHIYLDYHHKLGAMQYHPGAKWLVSNGYDPKMVKCVHLPRAQGLINNAKSIKMPYVILHELAHAYHDQFLSFNHPGILTAFSKAVKSKKYERVQHIYGHTTRHYALTTHKEYFAECTESFFGYNDFYPFVRPELKAHDPEMYAVLAEVWGVKVRK